MTVSFATVSAYRCAQPVCAAFSCAENNCMIMLLGAGMLLAPISILLPIICLIGLLAAWSPHPESRQTA